MQDIFQEMIFMLDTLHPSIYSIDYLCKSIFISTAIRFSNA